MKTLKRLWRDSPWLWFFEPLLFLFMVLVIIFLLGQLVEVKFSWR